VEFFHFDIVEVLPCSVLAKCIVPSGRSFLLEHGKGRSDHLGLNLFHGLIMLVRAGVRSPNSISYMHVAVSLSPVKDNPRRRNSANPSPSSSIPVSSVSCVISTAALVACFLIPNPPWVTTCCRQQRTLATLHNNTTNNHNA
jgi:hypothetical protein